ncbi:MAG: TolC family outer membrane protein [Azospirillaceae bacterium]
MTFRRQWLSALGVLALFLGVDPAARAQTLTDALASTYSTNPTLAAQRESLRASNEAIAQALSAYRPSVSADASVSGQVTYTDTPIGSGDEEINPASIGIRVEQPLYDFSRESNVDAAEFGIQAARAQYLATEQSVLLDAVSAYMNVVRDRALLDLAINNQAVLRQQLQAARDRFEVGEVTRTDVSQAESRVAGAQASIVQAEGLLRGSEAVFAQVVGANPVALTAPSLPTGLPTSLEEAVVMAEAASPSVIAAEFFERAAIEQIDVAEGSLLPRFSIAGEARHTEWPSDTVDSRTSASITLQMTWQFYQGGLASSQVREQRFTASQRRIEIDEARRLVTAQAISAWEALQTAQAAIESFNAQVRAAAIALEGVRQEAQVGSRTILDVLDAEQELLTARVNLVQAQRDQVVAAYGLLAAVGQLTARDLGLPVNLYTFGPDYDRARNAWIGTSIQ